MVESRLGWERNAISVPLLRRHLEGPRSHGDPRDLSYNSFVHKEILRSAGKKGSAQDDAGS